MLIIMLFILTFTPSYALGFDYFNDAIDYWNLKPSPTPHQKPKPSNEKKEKFNWKKHEDPKNDEFFEEGNHKPPKPFMELARDPSEQNIKRWFAIIEKKNLLMSRLHDHMLSYLAKKSNEVNKEEKELIENKLANLKAPNVDIRRFRFRLYFDSSCPHCERMLSTVQELQKMGYFIEVRQIDDKKPSFAIPFLVRQASKDELLDKKIDSWPLLFVADTKNQLIYRINGYQTSQNIMNILSTK
ncbi:MAG: hypothetical protein AB8G05_11765 [Oligoflexales bacterium]